MEQYKEFLLNACKFKYRNYSKLMTILLIYEFIPYVPFDQNRVNDAIGLRKEYKGSYAANCSVLEVLISLAIRMDREYVGYPGDPHPEIIFWEFLVNLGLTRYDDAHYDYEEVINIIKRFVDRKYDQNGLGGIFPLSHTNRDQRTVDLWGQMNEYILERYKNGY